MNRLTLSADAKELIIDGANGERATLKSARPNGFTDVDIERARDYQFKSTLLPGQINVARKFFVKGFAIFVAFGTGPPTWWIPKLRVGKGEVMLGWLRGMAAVHITRGKRPQ